MYLKPSIFSFVVLILMNACANNPEYDKNMINSGKQLESLAEELGLSRQGDQLTFQVYAPSLTSLEIIFYDKHDDESGIAHAMELLPNGVWKISLPEKNTSGYYAYSSSDDPAKHFADPYSKAVVRQNHYSYPSKTVILEADDFEWEGVEPTHAALGDLVILEAHLRDMTVHPSAGAENGGSYTGFIDPDQKGGIQHLKDMGINAVEFLPLQEFGNIEIDFKNPDLTVWNDWNPYENNHWGYMTSFFFAPEIYYGTDGVNDRGAWLGQDGRAVHEMKEMVKALHKEGISVIIDVVYNHVSQYDGNPFKLIDKEAYFRLDAEGDFLSHSGCGNDFKTEHPMARKMIVESLVYWMEEYHIDGFRFDLAAMIDLETIDAITEATRAINPDVLLIGEPWGGGGYNPAELADHDWASWNDHFRNSVKGRNPRNDDSGLIFGNLWDGNTTEHYKKLMRGYLQSEGGHYRKPVQSVNYLESHDDHTLGDFIRLSLGNVDEHQVLSREQVAKLSDEEIKIHKFAALNLLTSQGPVMLAQGQSWGRSKVIANSIGTDPRAGQIDHNSYEKDDETNWLNWDEKELNSELVDYYRGLIAIRSKYPELRNVEADFRSFIDGPDDFSFGFQMGDEQEVLVLINANQDATASFALPEGQWTILANEKSAEVNGLGQAQHRTEVAPQSGLILSK